MNNINVITPVNFPTEQVVCGFTTRSGGISTGAYASLNLGINTSDDPSAVKENHSILFRSLNFRPENVAGMKQVHGANIVIVDTGGEHDATDSLITATPGIVLSVRTADCIPLLLYDQEHSVAAAVHCGWRPLVGNIAEKTLEVVSERWNTDPSQVLAAIGPSARVCCYEIGMEVAERLHSDSVISKNGSLYGDLNAELVSRLNAVGIKKSNTSVNYDCTICTRQLYFSHRRDKGVTGRMMSYIMIK